MLRPVCGVMSNITSVFKQSLSFADADPRRDVSAPRLLFFRPCSGFLSLVSTADHGELRRHNSQYGLALEVITPQN